MPVRTIRFRPSNLLALALSALACVMPASAGAATTTLAPSSLTTTAGATGGQPVSALGVLDQSGTQNSWTKYVEFGTSSTAYAGHRTYTLPASVPSSAVTALTVQANYQGPAVATQRWTWSLYDWSTSSWTNIGDNTTAPSWGSWKLLTFAAPGTASSFVRSSDRVIRVRLKANNGQDAADIDFESVIVTSGEAAGDAAAPTAPGTLTASAGSASTATLSWGAATDDVGVTGYRVYRGVAQVATVTSPGYTDTGLSAATSYSYSVRAVDAAGNVGPASNVATITTQSAPDTLAPSAPTGLTASAASTSSITLAWNASSDDVGVAGYDVYRGSILVGATTALTFTDTGLAAGTTYTYLVRARDAAGNTSAASTSASAQTQTSSGSGQWTPPRHLTWYWQLSGSITDLDRPVDVYDIDGEDTSAATVNALHANGKKVICYFSGGTSEDWRSDYASFPASVKGSGVDGWAGEKWLDVRAISTLRPIMVARMQMCKDKGFDAVEPDNMDAYQNSSGFPLTAAHQLAYNQMIATEAHALGLAVFLKNDVDQLAALEPYFDGALNEQCAQYNECGGYSVFLDANKPVLQAEYGTKNSTRCTAANNAGRMAAYFNLNLDGKKFLPCW